MVIFGFVFILYFLKLLVGNGFCCKYLGQHILSKLTFLITLIYQLTKRLVKVSNKDGTSAHENFWVNVNTY